MTEAQYKESIRQTILGRLAKFFRGLGYKMMGLPSIVLQIYNMFIRYINGYVMRLSPLITSANVRYLSAAIITLAEIIIKIVVGHTGLIRYVKWFILYLILWGFETMAPILENAAINIPFEWSLEQRGQITTNALLEAARHFPRVMAGLFRDAFVPAYQQLSGALFRGISDLAKRIAPTHHKKIARLAGTSTSAGVTDQRLKQVGDEFGLEPIEEEPQLNFSDDSSDVERIDESFLTTVCNTTAKEILQEERSAFEEEVKILEAVDKSKVATELAEHEQENVDKSIDVTKVIDQQADIAQGDGTTSQDLVESNIEFYSKFGSLPRNAQIELAKLFGRRITLNQDGKQARENLERTDPHTTDYGLQGKQAMWAGIIISQAKDSDIV